ncbi:molecular chaperone MKKS-like [Clytia hemisphaerica]|uniref:molecular chaperone MKKS-like n=1 Tax=Clytia hemisphaerica TaxID=252671 RepID=UPI0034D75C26
MASISNDVHCQEKLSNLYKMLSHLHGPSSQHIAINNKLVCSAFELYHSITPTDDVINLMFGFLRQQNERYKNGGSAMGILATILIQEYLKFDVPIGTVMDNNELILSTCVREIRTLSVKCNIGRFSDVTKIIRPILMSKLLLTREESKHLCLTFARVFTMDNFWNNSHVIKLENEAILKTSLNDGLMLRLEQYTNFPNELTDVKVILYSVSIALDSEEVLEGGSKFDYQVESRSDLKESLLNGNVLRTCRLMHGLVQLIVCQKVIHPRAKKWFKDNAIYCIDRVGKACWKM